MDSMTRQCVAEASLAHVRTYWERRVIPALREYICIPNKSPSFDAGWADAGHMDRAVALFERFAREELAGIEGATVEVVQLKNDDGSRRTPLIFIEVPGVGDAAEDAVLLYGHLDKQPEFEGWREGLDPWTPVRDGDKLYGRGGADDGYAMFAAISAIRLNYNLGSHRARQVILIEACEESGSRDLPAYVRHLQARIGTPSLVVCLDSGAGNYERLWLTTSLRGLVGFDLTLKLMQDGVHSGGSGIVPDLFRLANLLIARLQDLVTGRILLGELFVKIPRDRRVQITQTAAVLGDTVFEEFRFLPGVEPMGVDNEARLAAGTWMPALTITGADGLPAIASAGNVLPARLTLRGSLRIPPTLSPAGAIEAVRRELTRDPPYGIHVTVDGNKSSSGWNSPALAPWLERALDVASNDFFGKGVCMQGQGGSIPFMHLLGMLFPEAQFCITGVLGPGSNAHGPNEMLDLDYAMRLTCCVASVLAAHAVRDQSVTA